MTLDQKALEFFRDLSEELSDLAELKIEDESTPGAEAAPPGTYFILTPRRNDSATIAAYVGKSGWINLEIGVACRVELQGEDDLWLMEALRSYVRGVVEGKFEETVWKKRDNVFRAEGELELDGETHRMKYRHAAVSLFGVGATTREHHAYRPYAS